MPAYYSSRLNESTHLVIHRDNYSEYPFIYVKIYREPSLVVVFDTGCGAENAHHEQEAQDLKDFIQDELLKGESANTDWLVVCTHCHFDHIGGIQSFANANASILASGYDLDFVNPVNRPANSLGPAFGLQTPQFHISQFAGDGESIRHNGRNLGLRALHTPGHTPDSLAIYDEAEKWLFLGDTFYQCVGQMPWEEEQAVPIVFPLQGDWNAWCASMQKLLTFVKAEDAERKDGIRVACGHTTSNVPAAELLKKVIAFGQRVADGSVPVIARMPGDDVAPGGSLGDETFVLWQDSGSPPFSMIAPERFEDGFKT